MQSDANRVCESRSNANSSCINVQCDKSIRKPEIILKYIDKLIESLEDSKPVTVVVSDSLKPEGIYDNSIQILFPFSSFK